MSLAIWLKVGQKVTVGGRELYMMPLPLRKLYGIGDWIEEQSKGVLSEVASDVSPGKSINPLVIISKVMTKIDVSELAVIIFNFPKDPDSGNLINPPTDKAFFDEYLDIPTAHQLFIKFIEMNQLEELVKNLRSLPVVKKLMEAASLTYGIPFLNSLPNATTSNRTQLEGSQSPKSTNSSRQEDLGSQLLGETLPKSPMVQ